MPDQVLLIDDDEALAELLAAYFQRYELSLLAASRPSQGMALLRQRRPQAVILDVMLPEKDGFEVCRDIRRDSHVPILMLTARGELSDRVVGLELGADDYLAKPFEPRELVARMQSLLRRARLEHPPGELLCFKGLDFKGPGSKGLEIDPNLQQASLGGRPLALTTSEYQLLMLLARHPNQVLSRDDIMQALKGNEVEIFSRAIDISVSRLRQKLKQQHGDQYIKTVWGRGYTFVGEAASGAEP